MEGQTIQWTKTTKNGSKQSKHYTNTTDWTIQTLHNDNEREKKQTNTHTMEKKQRTNKQTKYNNKRKEKKTCWKKLWCRPNSCEYGLK